jgi:hypothetical protein
LLDIHWYPEASSTSTGDRILKNDSAQDTATVVAREQAPRSLWAPSYLESSWIQQWGYGRESDVSNAIASADVFGIFAREGVFAASNWPGGDPDVCLAAAFSAYLDYDQQGPVEHPRRRLRHQAQRDVHDGAGLPGDRSERRLRRLHRPRAPVRHQPQGHQRLQRRAATTVGQRARAQAVARLFVAAWEGGAYSPLIGVARSEAR